MRMSQEFGAWPRYAWSMAAKRVRKVLDQGEWSQAFPRPREIVFGLRLTSNPTSSKYGLNHEVDDEANFQQEVGGVC